MLFEDFIRQYIKDLIECSDIEYDVKEEDIEDMVYNITNNEYLYGVIDECVYQQLDKYKEEE